MRGLVRTVNSTSPKATTSKLVSVITVDTARDSGACVIPERLRQGDSKFEAGLGNLMSASQNKNKKGWI